MKTHPKCYIYTRVSTAMQVDGYSLDAQKEKLRRYAEFQDMVVVGEYSDEGKSGKSVEGRPEFLKMIQDIESLKDQVSFVLVFKLSRFGRNAADVLTYLQKMQDCGVNLICVEDGIDSSKDSGKLMISVLSAVAEIERENILVQTMEGRKQKAREGRWNGGFAPYGYKLENGELSIAEDEAEVIRIIYDKYVHTTMGVSKIAIWLNSHGYKKKKRQNNTLDSFSAAFVRGVLENPIYCGKLAYGRRHNEKRQGTRNQYHIVKQEKYMLYDGIHEPIVSEADWHLAKQKRANNGGKKEKTHSLEHEHILSGLLCCPICGAGMYGNVNRKRGPDGKSYRDYFYYQCKHRKEVDGHSCTYSKQWSQDFINDAVVTVIQNLIHNPKFSNAIQNKIGQSIDTRELEQQLDALRKKLRQLNGAKNHIGDQIDHLNFDDPHYERKSQDLQDRQDRLYNEMSAIEKSIDELQARILNVRSQKIRRDNIYQYLVCFDQLYDEFTDAERKEFMKSFIKRVEIFPEQQADGRILKRIDFRIPVFFNDQEVDMLDWDGKSTHETVVLLSKGEIDSKKIRVELSLEDMDMSGFQKGATYGQIKERVLQQTGMKVSSLYIAQVKQKYGIVERGNYNKPKSENARQPKCPSEKEAAIVEALKHFQMI